MNLYEVHDGNPEEGIILAVAATRNRAKSLALAAWPYTYRPEWVDMRCRIVERSIDATEGAYMGDDSDPPAVAAWWHDLEAPRTCGCKRCQQDREAFATAKWYCWRRDGDTCSTLRAWGDRDGEAACSYETCPFWPQADMMDPGQRDAFTKEGA